MGKKSTPRPPDYAGAAREQGAASREITDAQTWANRPTQNTPWGTSSWEATRAIDPSTGKPYTAWTNNLDLNPESQKALDSQMNVMTGRSQMAEGLIGQARNDLSQPIDYGALPEQARTPDMPDFYGKNLPGRGTAPQPSSMSGGMNGMWGASSGYAPGQGPIGPNGLPAGGTSLTPTGMGGGKKGQQPTNYGGGPVAPNSMGGGKKGQQPQRFDWDNGGAGGPGQGRTPNFSTMDIKPAQRYSQGGNQGQGEFGYNANRYGQGTPRTDPYTPTPPGLSVGDPGKMERGDAGETGYEGLRGFGDAATSGIVTGGGANANNNNLGNFGSRQFALDPSSLREFGKDPRINDYNAENLQRGLDFGDLDQEVGDFGDVRNRAENSVMDSFTNRMDSRFAKDQDALRTQLYNQGLREGDAAYEDQMQGFNQNKDDAYLQAQARAFEMGGTEADRTFGQQLRKRQQGTQEATTAGEFTNAASGQALDQQLSIGGARFGEDLSRNRIAREQRGQQAGEQAQQFGQNSRNADAVDSQRAQRLREQSTGFDQGMRSAQFANSTRAQQAGESDQEFSKRMQAAQLQDSQRAAGFGEQQQAFDQYQKAREQMSGAEQAAFDRWFKTSGRNFDQNFATSGRDFQQGMTTAQYQDDQRRQAINEQLAMGGQQFNQEMERSGFQQQLRQQQLAEERARRTGSINEMNAALTGQQVQQPNMPSFQNANRAETPNLLGAANMQYGADMQQFGARQGQTQMLMNGITGLAGAAMPFF